MEVRERWKRKRAVGVTTGHLLRDCLRDLLPEGTGGGQIRDATTTDGPVDTQRKTESKARQKERGESRIRMVTQQRSKTADMNGRRDRRRNKRPKRVGAKSRRQERAHHRSGRRERSDRWRTTAWGLHEGELRLPGRLEGPSGGALGGTNRSDRQTKARRTSASELEDELDAAGATAARALAENKACERPGRLRPKKCADGIRLFLM